MATTEIDDLRIELERLRAENAALKAADEVAPEAETPARSRRPGLWRAFVSALLIVVAGILVPVSVVGAWAQAQLVNEETFVSTFAPLADDPDVQALIVDKTTAAINEAIDVQAITDDLFDGIQSLDLPPRASSAIDLLREPAAAGVQNLIDGAVTRVVESDAFSAIWQRALLASHRALVAVATNDGSGVVVIDDQGQIGIQLGPIIESVKEALVDQGFGLAANIPEIDRTVVVAQADALLVVGSVYNLAVAVGWWLPVITLVLFALGILFARRRSTATLGVGVAIALGSGILAAALTSAGTILGLQAGNLGVPAATLETIYYAVAGAMRDTAIVLTFLGIVIAVSAWLSGRWAPAQRVRGVAGSLTSSARASLQSRGLDTGSFGGWLHQQRVLVRILILTLSIVLLFALRPLSIGDILLTVVLALIVWLIVELLQRVPDAVGAPFDETAVVPDIGVDPEPVDVVEVVEVVEPEAVVEPETVPEPEPAAAPEDSAVADSIPPATAPAPKKSRTPRR
ncbi:hypothetical protein [Microbacterium terricola]|uniref:Integral membrane protein n=1 Tax=Microbacterium terricola TaxID=344163 RepID=A0ABM8DXP1_9MICO|nr:hypothetical protein [Microbacterium terricola]UYK39022.1 hypothetical protein OAU46_09940 [Microbacterium terricola]BDV30270.1 hypothetical protein Microterr_09300 [Microbacterium terricola]